MCTSSDSDSETIYHTLHTFTIRTFILSSFWVGASHTAHAHQVITVLGIRVRVRSTLAPSRPLPCVYALPEAWLSSSARQNLMYYISHILININKLHNATNPKSIWTPWICSFPVTQVVEMESPDVIWINFDSGSARSMYSINYIPVESTGKNKVKIYKFVNFSRRVMGLYICIGGVEELGGEWYVNYTKV